MRLKKIAHRIQDQVNELPHFSVLCQTGQLEEVKNHLEDADLDERSERGSTPIMHATWFGYDKVVDFLIDNGANVNLQNNRGNTALHFAYENNHKKIIKVGNGLVLLWIACVLHFLSLYNISADPFLLTSIFHFGFPLPLQLLLDAGAVELKNAIGITCCIAEKVRPAKLCYFSGGSIWKGGLNQSAMLKREGSVSDLQPI